MRLDPGDDQRVRYYLLPALLVVGRDAEASRLLSERPETSALWGYARALVAYRLVGANRSAARELRSAIGTNPHVIDTLCRDGPVLLPRFYLRGTVAEALFVARQLRPAFDNATGALEWIKAERQRRQREWAREQRRRRRNERRRRKRRG
jgi:hypothetical protein